MKQFLTASAVVEAAAGFGLLCFPSIAVLLLAGVPIDSPAAITVARIGGAGLLTLGIACWLARDDAQTRAARGLVVAMLFYDIVAAAVIAYAGIGLGLHSLGLWPAVLLHGGLTVWSLACLKRSA